MRRRATRRGDRARPAPRAAFGVGLALVGVYVLVAALTLGVKGQVRPLFDGIGPGPAYQWVKPPPQFAKSNLTPSPGNGDIPFSGGRLDGGVLQTPDGQFVVTLGPGAIALHGADAKVTGRLTPLDPATLDKPPAGLYADGNAYRIELTYSPSNQPVDTIATPGNVFVTAPSAAEAMVYSPDGRAWQQIDATQAGGPTVVESVFTRPGYYLAASSVPTATSAVPSASSSQTSGLVVPIAIVAGAALVIFAGSWAGWRIRRRRAS